jgi:microcin C transport system substrate-binding protein
MVRRILTLAGAALGLAGALAAAEPADIVWTTNYDDPPIGDPAALKGGTLSTYMDAYPLTLRLVGPNSNDAFASWKRAFTMAFGLVARHPTTDNYIPWMATHWSVQEDGRTIYYKLDPDARWSDGEPITAEDYVFTWRLMQSENIVDPFYNQYARDYYQEVIALGPYLLKVVGAFASWRPLEMFDLWATPRHAVTLEEGFPERYNNAVLPVQGPYVLAEQQTGQLVVFSRLADWWGRDKPYWRGMYNVDRIHIRVISDTDRAFDFFKKGELSYYDVNTARTWAEDMGFEAVTRGWVHRKRLFIDYPQGVYGFAMNLEKPIFQNKDFRKAIQYLFNFDEINAKLMYGAYYRQVSAFTGTEYENHDLVPYGFDPRRAREHLAAAGYTRRGPDGILVDANGNRAAFTLSYGSKGLERHLTVVRQTFRRFGIDMQLRLLEPGTDFRNGLEREYEMTIMGRTAGMYPSPDQYFGSVYKRTRNNNNIWAFGTAYTDSLIEVYRVDVNKEHRLAAMHELDAIVQDEAFYVPFWQAPFMRFAYWHDLAFPSSYFPKRTQQMSDWQVFWIDPQRQAQLREAMSQGRSLGEDTVVDVDPYKVKDRIEASLRAAAGAAASAAGQ